MNLLFWGLLIMILGLGLIVKNEEIDLPLCLDSFASQVDFVAIVDTGSTDNTIINAKNQLMRLGIRYKIVSYHEANDSEGRIADFSKARNKYIEILEDMGVDYIFSADADDTLVNNDHGDIKQQIRESKGGDVFTIKYRMDNGMAFDSFKLWRADLKLRFVGRVHEYLHFNWERKIVNLPLTIQHKYSYLPNQENGTQRNMRILRSEIYPPLRSLFYWSNENVDAKNYREAIKWYLEYIRRWKEGEECWTVELAHCYFRAARWLNALGQTEEAEKLSKELLDREPDWSESWCELAYIEKMRGNLDKAVEYCERALLNTYTPRLFSEVDKYTTTPTNMILEMRFKNVKTIG
jgi:glycosyltransferase involved in cell wall biosynthesis